MKKTISLLIAAIALAGCGSSRNGNTAGNNEITESVSAVSGQLVGAYGAQRTNQVNGFPNIMHIFVGLIENTL